jgi:hypothetical protein
MKMFTVGKTSQGRDIEVAIIMGPSRVPMGTVGISTTKATRATMSRSLMSDLWVGYCQKIVGNESGIPEPDNVAGDSL